MYEIEDGIPIARFGRKDAYPFGELEVGQSFFVPLKSADANRHYQQASITGAISFYRKQHPERRFVTRQCEKDGVRGVRVWRDA